VIGGRREFNASLAASLLVDDLQPSTSYTIQVCAVVGSTRGPYAQLEARTADNEQQQQEQPSAPLDFKYEPLESTMTLIRFKWRRPVLNADKIVRYRLFYRRIHYG